MQALEERLRVLEDREAIREPIARYGPLADSGDSEGVAALWAEDGIYVIAGMGEAKGREAIAALIDAPMHRQLMAEGCAHLLGPVAIDLNGDKATARGHSVVLHWTGKRFEVLRVAANRWDLARGADRWQVTHRDNALLQGGKSALALLTPPAALHRL